MINEKFSGCTKVPIFSPTHHLLQIAYSIHIEHDDRKPVLFTHTGSSQVHYLKVMAQHFVVSNSPFSIASIAFHFQSYSIVLFLLINLSLHSSGETV